MRPGLGPGLAEPSRVRIPATGFQSLASQRGVALPLAIVSLVILTAMMITFALLAGTEPTIAANQQHTAQALRLADSGLQLAIWGLNNSTDPSRGINLSAMAQNGVPPTGTYDGSTYTAQGGTGGFTVQVTWDPSNAKYERTVTAVGWTPSKDTAALNSHRKIHAIVQWGMIPPLDPPCVLCVAGEVQVNGSSASFDSSSGGCTGLNPPTYAVQTSQGLTVSGSSHPTFTGYGTSGQAAATNQTSNTSQFMYASDSLAKMKAYAQSAGTYYQGPQTSLPTSCNDSAHPCIVFIDTTDGSNFSQTSNPANDGGLSLSGNGTFTGIVVVAGTINISGTYTVNGLLYSLNDLSLSGHVTVNGAVVSENRRDTSSSNVDTDVSGNVSMTFDCSKVRNLPFSASWVVKTGAYQETSGY
jgi:hypothetical protein